MPQYLYIPSQVVCSPKNSLIMPCKLYRQATSFQSVRNMLQRPEAIQKYGEPIVLENHPRQGFVFGFSPKGLTVAHPDIPVSIKLSYAMQIGFLLQNRGKKLEEMCFVIGFKCGDLYLVSEEEKNTFVENTKNRFLEDNDIQPVQSLAKGSKFKDVLVPYGKMGETTELVAKYTTPCEHSLLLLKDKSAFEYEMDYTLTVDDPDQVCHLGVEVKHKKVDDRVSRAKEALALFLVGPGDMLENVMNSRTMAHIGQSSLKRQYAEIIAQKVAGVTQLVEELDFSHIEKVHIKKAHMLTFSQVPLFSEVVKDIPALTLALKSYKNMRLSMAFGWHVAMLYQDEGGYQVVTPISGRTHRMTVKGNVVTLCMATQFAFNEIIRVSNRQITVRPVMLVEEVACIFADMLSKGFMLLGEQPAEIPYLKESV